MAFFKTALTAVGGFDPILWRDEAPPHCHIWLWSGAEPIDRLASLTTRRR
jgi:hypothetical protein